MKTIVSLIVIIVLFATPTFASGTPADAVKVLSTKRYIFYFKADKRLIGGTVEIFDKNQHLVGTEKIIQAKTIVDFFNLSAGNYTIKIKKGIEEFVYPYVNQQ
jgi:hypothetical protein